VRIFACVIGSVKPMVSQQFATLNEAAGAAADGQPGDS
jgi:hypothetical protein